MKKIFILGLTLLTLSTVAQVHTRKPSQKQIDKFPTDTSEYPYALPILGKKAHARGYKLPLPAGLSVNYLWQNSSILINNLQVGFNGGTKYNLDNIISFNNATATTNGVNFRPDFWLFPFLNVYGIFSASKNSTAVDFAVNVPNGTGYTEVLSIGTVADFQATTVGFGLTPTFGVGGAFVAIDMNVSWSDIPELQKPARAFILGPRVGKQFHFKKEDRTLAVWVGGFRVDIDSETSGSLPLSSLFSGERVDEIVTNGNMKLSEAQTTLDNWWNGLTAQEKAQNAGRYAISQKAIDKGNDIIGSLETAASRAESGTVEYSLDKRQEELWNLVLGTQFQMNEQLMFRIEAGFLGTRDQIIAGIQYRFGI